MGSSKFKKYDIISVREYFPSLESPVATYWVYEQALGIQKHGIEPLVISPTPKFPRILQSFFKINPSWRTRSSNHIENYQGVDVIRPAYLKLPNKYFTDYNINATSKIITKFGNKLETKLIHAHFGHDGISSLELKKKNKIPLITSFYGFDLGSDKDKLSKYYKRLSQDGELFLALSNDMKMDLIDLGFKEEKIIVHHLGINTEIFNNYISQPSDSFTFLIIANFTKRKGIHLAIQAFLRYKSNYNHKNTQLRIVGDGPFKDELKKLASGHDNIVFINNYESQNPRQVVLEEMQKCDVFILTSITLSNNDKEGTPIVLMEAQACSKPCISTFHAGIPEVVINNETGILVKEFDVDEITNAMYILSQNELLYMNMSSKARIHVCENFDNNSQNKKLVTIYKSIASI